MDLDQRIRVEEDIIQKSQERILQLKTRRNMLSTTCRIPLEILEEIFLALVNSYATGYHISYGRCWLRWTVVTAVCRYWRSVSLRTPRMWACIPLSIFDESDLFSIFATRAGHIPLTLIQPLHESGLVLQTPQLKMVLSEFHRVQELSLVFGEHVLKLSEEAPGGLDAPHLRALTLSIDVALSHTQGSFPTIANASWPQLSSLQCTYGSLALVQAFARPSLTRLKLAFIFPPQPAIVWVNLFKGLPSLEELTMAEGIITDPGVPIDSIPQPTQTVTFNRLKYIYLDDWDSGIPSADFLNHLAFPADTRQILCIKTTDEELQFIFSAYAAKALGQRIIGGAPKPIHSLRIDTMSRPDFYRLALSTGDGWIQNNSDKYPIDSITGMLVEYLSFFGPKERTVQLFLSTYPVQQVRRLHLDCVYLLEADTWQTISALPSLREMGFTHADNSVRPFLELFSQTASFAKLEALVFEDIEWRRPHTSPRERRARDESLLPDLVRAVEARSERGQGLKRLELVDHSCSIGRRYRCHGDLQRLAELVETFKCSSGDDPNYTDDLCRTCDENSGSEVDSMAGDEAASRDRSELDGSYAGYNRAGAITTITDPGTGL